MTRILIVPLLIFSVVWGPAALAAQDHPTIRIIPRVGLMSPDSYFYEEFANFADDEPAEWTTGFLGRAAVVGIALEMGLGGRGIFLRGELLRSFGGWLSAGHGIIRPRVFFDPPEIVNTWLDIPASVTFASMQVVFPTQFKPWGIQPYAMVGGGGKWYHFGSPTRPNTVEAILPSNGFTPGIELGAGFFYSLYGLVFDTQIRDSINKYWEKTQHDLIFSQGLVWRIR
jgi:hypothetical protein